MTATRMYRVRTRDLLDQSLDAKALAARVERYGAMPASDGITVDGAGNVYITDILNNAIGVIRPGGAYERLFQGDGISWPDGFAVGPDGNVYVTVNELHRSATLAGGEEKTRGLFKIMRFPALAPATPGR